MGDAVVSPAAVLERKTGDTRNATTPGKVAAPGSSNPIAPLAAGAAAAGRDASKAAAKSTKAPAAAGNTAHRPAASPSHTTSASPGTASTAAAAADAMKAVPAPPASAAGQAGKSVAAKKAADTAVNGSAAGTTAAPPADKATAAAAAAGASKAAAAAVAAAAAGTATASPGKAGGTPPPPPLQQQQQQQQRPGGSSPAEASGPAAGSSAAPAAAAGAGVTRCDLSDPACMHGTPEFEAAASRVLNMLDAYKAKTKQHLASGRAKPDMIAYSELRSALTQPERHGHIPGVRVGQSFLGRGELAILGLHTQMMRGIMARKGEPAYAICMSGGYKDDADTGGTFWYTGQGGQGKNNVQMRDQEYSTPDNAALVESCSSRTPVRVFRGKVGAAGERLYVYEGLYRVAAHKQERSQDGPLVIKFQMVGVPGHHVVSGTVDFKCLTGASFQTVLLARGPAAKPGRKRGRAGELRLLSAGEVKTAIEQRAAGGSFGRLVSADLSKGQEKLPIPVWNALDDDDRILLPMAPLGASPAAAAAAAGCAALMLEDAPEFEYTRDYKFGEEEAKQLAIAAEQAFASSFPGTCGIVYSGKVSDPEGNYNEDGLMMSTQPCGLMECDEGCTCSRHCKLNSVVSQGIRHPLEVFKVSPEVGWGVRCTADLPIGAFVCCYIGLVITDEWADKLRNEDLYLFDLNHFHLLWDAEEAGDMPDVPTNPHLHPLQGQLRSKHLVIDAARQGNVGRFLNHSCSPNCLVQTVFAGNARSQLLYYICIVAQQDIPAFTELTYDYGWTQKRLEQGGEGGDGVRIRCQCGSAQCRHRLI